MTNKLMITAAFTAIVSLFAPALTFVSFADESIVAQSAGIDYSTTELFHSKFSINDQGRPRIAFDAVRNNAGPFLTGYIDHLSKQNVDGLSENEQLAYWLNVQNIVAIHAISFDTKKSSLKKLRGTADAPGKLWTSPRFNYAGRTLSLVDIENKIINLNDDPNVLYGIYQGVRGGPRVSRTAYQANTVTDALAKAGKTYVNSRGIVKVDSKTAKVTPVFTWYKDTLFAGDDAQLISHMRSHAYPRLSANLQRAAQVEDVKLSYRTDAYQAPSARRTVGGSSGRSAGGYGS